MGKKLTISNYLQVTPKQTVKFRALSRQVYDRSPCGTGTSAKIACLAADGKLESGKLWKQASIIGSQFIASYEQAGEYVIPTIRGEAYMSAEATLFMDENDPFAWGIQL